MRLIHLVNRDVLPALLSTARTGLLTSRSEISCLIESYLTQPHGTHPDRTSLQASFYTARFVRPQQLRSTKYSLPNYDQIFTQASCHN